MQNGLNKTGFPLVLLATFITFCAFYAPQPLLPFFTQQFDIPESTAALLITVTFILLCVGPLITGAVLRHVTARVLLIWSLAALGCLQIGFGLADSFNQLLFYRTCQACLYPVIFTAAVTYCSQSGTSGQVARRVSFYIATTILGGLGGRLVSGFLSTWYSWPLPFLTLGFALLACALLLGLQSEDKPFLHTSTSPKDTVTKRQKPLLAENIFRYGFLLIFTTFFSFAALLNVLPFRLADIDPAVTSSTISLVYFGYLPGAYLAASSGLLVDKTGGANRLMFIALTLFLTGLGFYLVTDMHWDMHWLIVFSCVNASGFFLLHATLSSYLNSYRPAESGRINGWYISVYYAAGALGSWLPVLVYTHFGWLVFLALVALVSALGYVSLHQLRANRQPTNT